MSLYDYSDQKIAKSMGQRINAVRLQRNMTQQDLARETGTSRVTLQKLLSGGNGKLVNFIACLRALDILDEITPNTKPPEISPVSLLKSTIKNRKRARNSTVKPTTSNVDDW